MAKNKTTETTKSVDKFIKSVFDVAKRKDCIQIIDLMQKQSGFPPKMWGSSIVGFGTCHYIYESGREGDMPLVAFSPRSTALVLYLSGNFTKRDELLKKFGKHKTSKGCVYVKKLDDINTEILKKMITASIKHVQALYPEKKTKTQD